jgi:MFS family permease
LRYRLGGRRAWMVWSSAISVYALAVFHRTSMGVAGLVAAERFHISSAQLATFTMVQLLVYAAMQIPVGAMLDRVGAKKLLVTGVFLMTGGQFAFAFAGTFGAGVAARVFVGMGDALIFICLVQLVALWFRRRGPP